MGAHPEGLILAIRPRKPAPSGAGLRGRIARISGLPPKEASRRIEDLLHQQLDAIRDAHDEFDSSEEYAANARVCNFAVPRILGWRR
jgi:hypothetical protein